MSNEIKRYFAPLKKGKIISIDFDIYYYCAVMGMAHLKQGNFLVSEEFVKTVPAKYQDGKYKEMLLMLLNAEIERSGCNLKNRNDVKQQCNLILDSSNINQLTPEGASLLNGYCVGGYALLKEADLSLSEPSVFFEEYVELLSGNNG
jgi:hypothetical protein